MKPLIKIFLVISLLLFSCDRNQKKETLNTHSFSPFEYEDLESAIIYEANIRQYSLEGTFNAFTKDIPSLRELGINIIWLMPIHPISKTKAKGTLGSYYAVSDYTAVNPEFGTLEDLRTLIKVAHQNGIYVILDWVANHTGWDHVWVKTHPDFYSKDETGHIIDPINPETKKSWGWTDVADLDYNNLEMRNQMIQDMNYWIEEEDIDGFRCDVAHGVPVSFWKTAFKTLQKHKPLILLAEAENPELMDNIFNIQYAWTLHHILNGIATGEKTVADFDTYMEELKNIGQTDDIYMNFTSNHDENSWAGPVKERLGDASEVLAALTYAIPGIPLIYSGQEYDLDKRLAFFDKDTIPHTIGSFYPFYKKMNALKNTNKALNGGMQAASYKRIQNGNTKILSFIRKNGEDEIIFIANLSKEKSDTQIALTGNYISYLEDENNAIITDILKLSLNPWEYKILVRQNP